MAGYKVEVSTAEFEAAMPPALEDLRLRSEDFIVQVGDKVVRRARELAPKRKPWEAHPERAGELAASIQATPPVRTSQGVELMVTAGGAGIREAAYMEFGTYKDRPQPYMRPALAEAAGGLRSAGYAARLASSTQSSLFVRRARARAIVKRQQPSLQLSSAQQRVVGQTISQRLRYRGPKVTYRRPRRKPGA